MSNSKKKTMANTRRLNMKADRNMDVAIANLSCDRLATLLPSLRILRNNH
jgi:hypothetical protein